MANHDEVSASGPGGFGVVLKAQNVLTLLILAAALGGMIYFQREDKRTNVTVFHQTVTKLEGTLATMKLEHAALLEACKEGR